MADRLLKTDAEIWFGGDPELFLSRNGQIVGSEKAVPEDGFEVDPEQWQSSLHAPNGRLAIVRDGVQIELNLPPTNCRQWLVLEICKAFVALRFHLARMKDRKLEVSFRQVVDVSKDELASLSKMSRRLGCQPSFNWYSPVATIGVDPETYTKRSAGGHLHFGLPGHLMSERERLPPLFDILLGNTCVMIDRDPGAAERRQVYGRAGEFRLPRHGIEYRTLSNFWLHCGELVSFVTGLGRLAIFVLDTSVAENGWPADQALMDLVDLKDIERAINTNDCELAKANFKGVATFLQRHHSGPDKQNRETSLNSRNLDAFDAFIDGIDHGGIERWFPTNPMDHWPQYNWMQGWESFLAYRVPTFGVNYGINAR